MRKAVQITGAACIAAVLMTGCSKSSDNGGGKKADGDKATASAQPAAPGSNAPAPDPGSDNKTDAAALNGGWADLKSPDGAVGLYISGTKAAVVNGAHKCSGGINQAKPATLDLSCADGDSKRTHGTVEKVDGSSLTVAWASGAKETFAKAGMPGASGGASGGQMPQLPDLSKIGH